MQQPTSSGSSTPDVPEETPEKKVEVYENKGAWWAEVHEPGRLKTIRGPFSDVSLAQEAVKTKKP